jgi:hypothetical protein
MMGRSFNALEKSAQWNASPAGIVRKQITLFFHLTGRESKQAYSMFPSNISLVAAMVLVPGPCARCRQRKMVLSRAAARWHN